MLIVLTMDAFTDMLPKVHTAFNMKKKFQVISVKF